MCLVRFSYSEEPIKDLKKKIRHIYDLHLMLQEKELSVFFQTLAFDEMLLKVANDDVISYKNSKDWLRFHPIESIMFADVDSVWEELKDTYMKDFKKLVYGHLPEVENIQKTLRVIQKRLLLIQWSVNIK